MDTEIELWCENCDEIEPVVIKYIGAIDEGKVISCWYRCKCCEKNQVVEYVPKK